jgi:hypothetical protein
MTKTMKVHTLIVGGVTFSLTPPDHPPKKDERVLGLVNVHETLAMDKFNREYYSPHEPNLVVKILHYWQGRWEDEDLCQVACEGWVSMSVGKPAEVR